jgi:hypothetical protein
MVILLSRATYVHIYIYIFFKRIYNYVSEPDFFECSLEV